MEPNPSTSLQKLIAKCWADEDFKNKLLADPAGILVAEGVTIPPGLEVRIVENTPGLRYLVLPQKPDSSELSDIQLDQIAAGTGTYSCGSIF